MDDSRSIKDQNDAFRCHTQMAIAYGIRGKIILTKGVADKSEEDRSLILDLVRMFGQYAGLEFTEENDPYQEHDFGAFDYLEERFFWKIDYYNSDFTAGSEDPLNPTITRRVLTVMLADEY